MSHRNWMQHTPLGVGIAVALALFGAALIKDHQGQRGNIGAQQHASDTPQRAQDTGVSVVGRRQAPPPDPKPDRKEWREENDLQAQRRMAHWAVVAALAAVAGAFVTATGIWFIKQTLDATRETVRQANAATQIAIRQAEAAVEGNVLARIANAAQSRPWVTFDKISLTDGIKYAAEGPTFSIRVHFKSFGSTPALKVSVLAKVVPLGDPSFTIESFQRDFVAELDSFPWSYGFLMAPGRTLSQDIGLNISRADMDKIRSPNNTSLIPVIMCGIRYQSTFSTEVLVTTEAHIVTTISDTGGLPFDGPDVPIGKVRLSNFPIVSGYAR